MGRKRSTRHYFTSESARQCNVLSHDKRRQNIEESIQNGTLDQAPREYITRASRSVLSHDVLEVSPLARSLDHIKPSDYVPKVPTPRVLRIKELAAAQAAQQQQHQQQQQSYAAQKSLHTSQQQNSDKQPNGNNTKKT